MSLISPLKILIAEDERIIAIQISRALKQSGHTVHSVRTGKEAVKALSSEYFDIVLMDIEMPEMDGIEATRRIRQTDDSFATIPIIGVSANQAPPADRHCKETGMDDFIPKPFSLIRFEEAYRMTTNRRMFR